MKYNFIEIMRLTPNFNQVLKSKIFSPLKLRSLKANAISEDGYSHFVILTLMNQGVNLILLLSIITIWAIPNIVLI